MKQLLIIIILVLGIGLPALKAQSDSTRLAKDSTARAKDSVELAHKNRKKIYSTARKATIMSAILPGFGQAYNKKYWKLPIIYAGIAGFGYLFITNNKEYKFYRKNLIAVYDNDPNTVNTTPYSGDQLQILKTSYRKNRDLGLIGVGIIYVLNIIDANVDGHLRTFDVSDDLSLSIDPWEQRNATTGRMAAGLSLKLNFK